MALPHGDTAINQDVVSVVDDSVHDGLGDGAAVIRIGIDAFIPFPSIVLGAEDHGTAAAPALHDFQQVIGLLRCQTADQPLVQDEKVYLLVGADRGLKTIAGPCQSKVIQQFRQTDIANGQELSADTFSFTPTLVYHICPLWETFLLVVSIKPLK